MNKKSTQRRSVKITDKVRKAYESRDKSLDHDPNAPTLPLEKWACGEVGKFYRPMKTQISFRIDNDVLDWLKSAGEGHLTRINQILRERMEKER
jgi:uncharacterized protein (DUF4415 family)